MPLCACGCARAAWLRTSFATQRCRWRVEKRRTRARVASGGALEIATCAVCHRDLVRGGKGWRRRYHDACRPIARKLLRDARENRADTRRESSR